MIIMQAPPDLTAFCVAGAPVDLRTRRLAVDEKLIEVFRAHGFTPRDVPLKTQNAGAERPPREERVAKEQTP
ncbi:MAG TPA: hypothetical protein VEH76_03440 [Methylocystis sp.]|nr:hypothetical protein [Methylocystis sp.]